MKYSSRKVRIVVFMVVLLLIVRLKIKPDRSPANQNTRFIGKPDQGKNISYLIYISSFVGIALQFVTNVFQSWMKEKDFNTLSSALRKAELEDKLLVNMKSKE